MSSDHHEKDADGKEVVRWGVLSTAGIAVKKVIPGMRTCRFGRVAAIASRHSEAAEQAARSLDIPRWYGSYEELLTAPDISAVYIPLPNHLHVEWAVRALEAGKHVLCEKPVGLDSDQVRVLMDAASRHPELKVMEAFMYRFHPQWVAACELVSSGKIGELRTIQSFFSYFNADGANIRNRPETGGGGLMDIGCYCILLSRLLFEREPQRVCGWAEQDPAFGTDRLFSGMMDFGSGVSSFTCSTQLHRYQRVNILGTEGRVEIMIPFNAPPDEPCVLIHEQGQESVRMEFGPSDQYALQADAFARAVLDDTPVPIPLADSLENMRVLQRLRASAETGQWT